jgi:DNA-binding PadR family transcriptional regulator
MQSNQSQPLSEASFFILLSLVAAPKHGYAILKEVEYMSKGRVVLATGTLYTALRRMLEDGWIERIEDRPLNGTGRDRKLYRLTDEGRRIFNLEAERLKDLASLARLQTIPE